MPVTTERPSEAATIRDFHVDFPEEPLVELRRRVEAAQWPGKELVSDHSQGVQLAAIQALARYWAVEHDWRACEAKLNALPQFKTKIDGLDIHFIHVKSRHENALPLIITHGWPGSVIELLGIGAPPEVDAPSKSGPTHPTAGLSLTGYSCRERQPTQSSPALRTQAHASRPAARKSPKLRPVRT